MAHTLSFPAHPGHRQNPQPGLAIDGTRIAANAGAIAINAVALLLLLAPVALPPPAPLTDRDPVITWLRPTIEPKPIRVPVVNKPQPRQSSTKAQPSVARVPQPLHDSQPTDTLLPMTDALVDADPGEPVDLTPKPAASTQLQAISAPSPRYPSLAIRSGLTGTVELEILVDTDGKPLEVRVVRSSGHRVLDQAALRVVLSQWRFQPAMHDGYPVQALGRVPIAFTLER